MKSNYQNQSISHTKFLSEKSLNELLNLDYFIYSSHKSGTQTLVGSLVNSGLKCKHIHNLTNLNLTPGDFRFILDSYKFKNNKKMIVITVFRNPLERHISSFFQWHGTRPLLLKEVRNINETIIYKSSIKKLQDKFLSELRDQSLVGFSDSLHEIFQELEICADDLKFNNERNYGIYETEKIKLYFLKFDIFFNEYNNFLSKITGIKISQQNRNMSENKFYREIYTEFKKTLSLPNEVISDVFNSKWDLMKLFYDKDAQSILSECYIKYGRRIN